MPSTTPSGRTRVPTAGDDIDIPRDILNAAVDLEGIADALAATSAIRNWIRAGRVDRQIEGNGYLRLLRAESFPGDLAPNAVVGIGIDTRFRTVHWDGLLDGSGVLLRVADGSGNYFPPAGTVAIYYVCARIPTS